MQTLKDTETETEIKRTKGDKVEAILSTKRLGGGGRGREKRCNKGKGGGWEKN